MAIIKRFASEEYVNENIETTKTEIESEISQLQATKVYGIGIARIMAITQADYDALEVKDSETLYIITDSDSSDVPNVPEEPEEPDVPDEPEAYTITNNLTHITTNNNVTSVYEGNTYTAILTADTNYSIDSVMVTMGGVDVTGQVYSDGTINIPNVTGDVVITAVATTSLVTMPYLLSDTACYVNTGYAINTNTTAFEITLKDEVATANRYYMGTFESNITNEGGKWFASKLIATRIGYSIDNYTKKHTHKRTLQEMFVDGVSVATTTTAPSWHDAYQKYVTLFAYNNAKFDATPSVDARSNANIYFYGAKIWEGESLVRDLVPAKDSNGVACVYDNVTGEYLYNEGTGTLTYGTSLEEV